MKMMMKKIVKKSLMILKNNKNQMKKILKKNQPIIQMKVKNKDLLMMMMMMIQMIRKIAMKPLLWLKMNLIYNYIKNLLVLLKELLLQPIPLPLLLLIPPLLHLVISKVPEEEDLLTLMLKLPLLPLPLHLLIPLLKLQPKLNQLNPLLLF